MILIPALLFWVELSLGTLRRFLQLMQLLSGADIVEGTATFPADSDIVFPAPGIRLAGVPRRAALD